MYQFTCNKNFKQNNIKKKIDPKKFTFRLKLMTNYQNIYAESVLQNVTNGKSFKKNVRNPKINLMKLILRKKTKK